MSSNKNVKHNNLLIPKIVFEDDSILIVDKPPGWITNEADTTSNQPVLQTWVKTNFKFPIFANTELRNGIVHRLDKETSGILIIAKTKEVFEELQRQFKERIVKKTYTALVHGKVSPETGEIKVSVGRLPWRRDRFGIIPGGRDSLTKYKVITQYVHLTLSNLHLKDYSLVELHPETGRTHQIRIHMKYIGHPLVSDEFYAGRKTARSDRKWCPRLFLHASGVNFIHPLTGKKQEFTSNLTKDLTSSLQSLKEA